MPRPRRIILDTGAVAAGPSATSLLVERFLDHVRHERGLAVNTQAAYSRDLREFADWLEKNGEDLKFLRYGFQFTKSNLQEEIVSGQLDKVVAEAVNRARDEGETRRAVVESVDDAWEVSLLKLAVDTARRSAGGNMEECKRRGLL